MNARTAAYADEKGKIRGKLRRTDNMLPRPDQLKQGDDEVTR